MLNPNKYTVEKITYIHQWAPNLFSFRTTRNPNFKFIAGQFARLGIQDSSTSAIWRPYSIVSATTNMNELEFYSIIVPDGKFTTRLKDLVIGAEIFVDKTNYGLLTTDRFDNGKDLWLLSTGTGLAPFISILYDVSLWQQYQKIILVHCARESKELAYQQLINEFANDPVYQDLVRDKLIYIRVLTREGLNADLYGRITTLLINSQLEHAVNIQITKEQSRIMICGNPDMVKQTREILIDRGLAMSRKDNKANIVVENYW
jgi:ferredoxin--NADP+ reductase